MLYSEYAPLFLLCAMALDGLVGDPQWLWRRFPHPVVLMGSLIEGFDQHLNRTTQSAWQRRLLGIVAISVLVAIAALTGWTLHALAAAHPVLTAVEIIIVTILLAQRSLYDHVDAVRQAFANGGITAARKAVSMIVGRNPESLDEAAVCRASIESAAENLSDGIIAPAFWYLLAGLPGLLAYKMINTADSMIGHRTPRHEAFGWAAARIDDVANLAPARLSAILLALAAPFSGGSISHALAVAWRDASRHRSPNAGWPEAAMAAALGIALAGPRTYGDTTVTDPWMNAVGRQTATPNDIARALRVLVGGCTAMAAVVAAIAMITALR